MTAAASSTIVGLAAAPETDLFSESASLALFRCSFLFLDGVPPLSLSLQSRDCPINDQWLQNHARPRNSGQSHPVLLWLQACKPQVPGKSSVLDLMFGCITTKAHFLPETMFKASTCSSNEQAVSYEARPRYPSILEQICL